MNMSRPQIEWSKNGLKVTTSSLKLEPTDKYVGRRRQYRLLEPFRMRINTRDFSLAMKVTVPAGFHTDFATLPIFTQLLLGNRDDWAEAAVVHDWLCYRHVPYFICNSWMRTVMYCYGAPRWKRMLFFYGLMFFGYGSWISRGLRWVRYRKKR